MKHKFKVGDRVENISACYKGMKARIVEIDKEGLPYHIKFDNNTFLWELEEHLKLIPPMKNIKDLGEKVAIQCKTQEEWDFVRENIDNHTMQDVFMKEYPCLIVKGNYGSVQYAKERKYTILQASDFMPLSPQDEIKELKERIATLEETLRPKKKIEFVKYLTNEGGFEVPSFKPNNFKEVELVYRYDDYDIMEAYDDESDDKFIYLGHFNDGEK